MATTSHVKLEEHEQREMDSLNKELREVQGKTMNVISQMININVDTLETIERQIEQTEDDLRMLGEAQEELNEARDNISDIRLGLFAWGKKPKTFKLPEKIAGDVDYKVMDGGKPCTIRMSVLMYQIQDDGTSGSTCLPYSYVQRCIVKADGKTVEIEFRPDVRKMTEADSWTFTLQEPTMLQDFVKNLRAKVIAKGHDEMKSREKANDFDKEAWMASVFLLKFEDPSQAFEVSDDMAAVTQGVVLDLMRDFKAAVKDAKAQGEQGALSHDMITSFQLRGLQIVNKQMIDIGGNLQQHMDLLMREQELMINLKLQTEELDAEAKELIAMNDGCCTCCGCTCVVM